MSAAEKRKSAPHAPLPPFDAEGTVLAFGGQRADALVEQHGSPLFVYDGATLDGTLQALRSAMPKRLALHYAVKANPFKPVVQRLAAQVDGLDVASAGELEMVRGCVGGDMPISFAGPGKRDEELSTAIELDCTVNLESENELQRLAKIAREKGVRAKAAIRVNPAFELRGSGMRMGGGAKPFGMDDTLAPDVLARWPTDALDFRGFHIFTGSQSLSAEALAEAHENALMLALDLAKHAPCAPATINIGGGLGVPYFPGDQALDVTALGAALDKVLNAQSQALGDARVIMELGRYMVAEAGVYLTRVVDKKVSRGQTFLVTDGGLHHQLAVSGNFGQVFRKNYPVAIATKFGAAAAGEAEDVNIVGCLCTPLDRLADNVTLPVAEVGDLVAVFRCGAYGPTASPAAFLGHPPAGEVLVG